jgi:hypothetical protein
MDALLKTAAQSLYSSSRNSRSSRRSSRLVPVQRLLPLQASHSHNLRVRVCIRPLAQSLQTLQTLPLSVRPSPSPQLEPIEPMQVSTEFAALAACPWLSLPRIKVPSP